MDFEEYKDTVEDILINKGYRQIPDEDVILEDYEAGYTPMESAGLFIEEWEDKMGYVLNYGD